MYRNEIMCWILMFGSLYASFMLARKNRNGYIVFNVMETGWFWLDVFFLGYYGRGIFDLFCFCMNCFGYKNWGKKEKIEQENRKRIIQEVTEKVEQDTYNSIIEDIKECWAEDEKIDKDELINYLEETKDNKFFIPKIKSYIDKKKGN